MACIVLILGGMGHTIAGVIDLDHIAVGIEAVGVGTAFVGSAAQPSSTKKAIIVAQRDVFRRIRINNRGDPVEGIVTE